MYNYRILHPKKIDEKLNFLLDSQNWPKETIEDYQFNKLRSLIDYTYENIPYYQELFDKIQLKPQDINQLQDIKYIPVLTKKDIRKNFDRLIDPKLNKKKLMLNFTGGSTGIPLKFYHDENYLINADAMRIRNWKYHVGFNKNEKEAILWGDARDIRNVNLKKIIKFFIYRNIEINTFNINEKKFLNFFKLYNILKPNIIRGYASSLFFAAEIINKNNLDIHPPKSIISSAETLSNKMRDYIENTFNSKVYNSYGSREVSQIAMECHYGNMHLSSENQIVELVENENYLEKNLKNIVVTNLNNHCMPFIRYEIGNLAESINNVNCECGITHQCLNGLAGRENENIVLNDGRVINGEFFEFLFDDIDEVERYQVLYTKSQNNLLIRLQADSNHNEIELKLKNKIKRSINSVKISFEFNKDFQKTPSGNFKFVWTE